MPTQIHFNNSTQRRQYSRAIWVHLLPWGKFPKGAARLNLFMVCFASEYPECTLCIDLFTARGTSEPGPLGVICGDPVLARIQRDLPGVKVLGYPVQVNKVLLSPY